MVETDSDGLVLVETGLGLGDVRDPDTVLGRAWVEISQPVLAEAETAIRQVEGLGFAILHEPVSGSLVPDPAQATLPLRKVVAPFVEAGNLRGAAGALLRTLNGEQVYADLPPAQLERMLGNAEILLGIDLRGLSAIEVAITEPQVPLTIVHGTDSPEYLTAGARGLAGMLGKEPITLPGAHVPQLTHPAAVADLIRRVAPPA
ncbi:hypothetical protein [Nocardia sp. NPDC020380]|uniref:hypothetical protein n=1 Tax=Nocardia sp. NPDC020380 TaxID=3364309 RepID=UPI0037AA3C31